MEPRARLLPKPATFLHPESQEMGGCALTYPDCRLYSEQSDGKIFKRAMKSGPMLNNIWNLSLLQQLQLPCLCSDS